MWDPLFELVCLGKLELPNRFVRSATYDGMCSKLGEVTERQLKLYEDLAKGGVGLIISGIASVHPSGRISAFQNDISHDGAVSGLKRLVDGVHAHGARIAVQLFHGGYEAFPYQNYHRRKAWGPWRPQYPEKPEQCHVMTEGDIRELIEAFGKGAQRAKSAGFDGVQIHAAHAYLFPQFLSPVFNRRTDQWGGTLDNRLRFLKEVYHRVRQEVGEDYPVLIKLGVADGFAGGLSFDEGRIAANACSRWGFDLIEISQGLRGKYYQETEFRPGINQPEKEAYFKSWTQAVKEDVDTPVILVGGVRTPQVAADMVTRGVADLVALCRPLIRRPDLINCWRDGDGSPSTCISCNLCYEEITKGRPLCCVADERARKKVTD